MPQLFPGWARIALGLILAFLGYLVAGPVLHASAFWSVAIPMLTTFFAGYGVVPPRPGDLHFSPTVHFILTGLALAGTLIATLPSVHLGAIAAGIIVAAINVLASIGIVPPQATGRA